MIRNLRKIVIIIFVTICIVSNSSFVHAYDGDEHDKIFKTILFGENFSSSDKDINNKIKMLDYASYLCIDQFNASSHQGGDEKKLKFLKDNKVRGLSSKIEEIDLNTKGLSGNHRNYTHRGWNFNYVNDDINAKSKARQTVLLQTVNKVFDFNRYAGKFLFWDLGFSEQCEAFSKFVYYIHIIGDCDAKDSWKVDYLMIDLATAHPDEDNKDIFYELNDIFPVIFKSQVSTRTYISFKQDFDILAEDARRLAGSKGGIDDDDKFKEYHEYCEELIELLKDNIPKLLKNEEFFKTQFYKEK